METIVIVGSGLAGYTLARELRKRDRGRPLTLITADDGAFYSKPMLSSALSGGKSAAQLVTHSAQQMATQLGAQILCGHTVTAIDPAAGTLRGSAGEIRYGQLVLALGARPIRLPFAGDAATAALSVNNLADYARFRQQLAHAPRVAIIGAGLIGCEFADDLQRSGHAVTVFDLGALPLGRLAPPMVAGMLMGRLAASGVSWCLGRGIARIDRHGDAFALTADDGHVLIADLVLSAIGLQPETALASAAGLAVARGVQVDASLRSSDARIYALGDCAEVDGLVQPFVLPIMHGARALAASLSGAPTSLAYPPMPVVVKTPSCPTVVCSPAPHQAGSWAETGSDAATRSIFVDAVGTLRGFALCGEATSERQALAAQIGTSAV